MSESQLFSKRSIDSIIEELGSIPRAEHPRPDRFRRDWTNLNGIWEFAFDPENIGENEGWGEKTLSDKIVVPFCPESVLSGVFDEEFHKLCWYARSFDLPTNLQGKRVILHFGAVDYRTDVWLNGKHLGQHVGGYDSFCFDVTDAIKPSGNRLVLRVDDDPQEAKPKGKQSPERYPSGCAYMRTTGIWQTVWLEAVGEAYVKDWTLVGNPETGELSIDAKVNGSVGDLSLSAVASLNGKEVATKAVKVADGGVKISLTVPDPKAWSPNSPTLYDLEFKLTGANGAEIDSVRTYFGLRSITIKDGMVQLNGKPFFIISALDQGYYPQSLYTPPTDDALREDVVWAMKYGLNHVRKHQMVAEPRFHYWCDKLGLTIWEEMADWGAPLDSDDFMRQWSACIKRDINHPCIISWVCTNEQKSPDDDAANQIKVHLCEATKALDPTRPAIDTSGYCHTITDITDLHVNPKDGADVRRWWREWRENIAENGNFMAWPNVPTYCKDFKHKGQPVVISETGNWWIEGLLPLGEWKAYGAGPIASVDEYMALYRDFFLALMAEPECAGFSYVQLYDLEGEVNGYLTYDRKPKVSPEAISAIHAEGLKLRKF